ncbi:hypothetical protein A374_08524 [Fictibacillus macauensis ZFHKF-1]|uniref:YhzD-like protein n=1 Tax=Fictibacillus macauensis ZFHKF-1 TaxID=1196324 RepID=I8J296_9BACL|nr:YhzD family protein [Fictibacillus macauensis]EIT85866.1 hypothetical protein A374_08524 [Fictibacillus macauensis ZFHKF-1]
MKKYFLTVYAKNGEKLLDEAIEAATDQEAKAFGTARLTEKEFSEHTHRLISPAGSLLLFHR